MWQAQLNLTTFPHPRRVKLRAKRDNLIETRIERNVVKFNMARSHRERSLVLSLSML